MDLHSVHIVLIMSLYLICSLPVLMLDMFGFGWVNVKFTLSNGIILRRCSHLASLNGNLRSFFIVLCAVCWALWQNKNNIVVRECHAQSMRSIICLIISLVNYWSGQFGAAVVPYIQHWLPGNMELIPIQVLSPLSRITSGTDVGR
jgi:hypothetical protein